MTSTVHINTSVTCTNKSIKSMILATLVYYNVSKSAYEISLRKGTLTVRLYEMCDYVENERVLRAKRAIDEHLLHLVEVM